MAQSTLNYGKLVRTSWDMIKKRPYLWILGLLGGSGGGGFNFFNLSGGDFSDSKKTSFNGAKDWLGQVAGTSVDNLESYSNTGFSFGLIIVLILTVILLMILSVIFRSGLIQSVVEISKGVENNFKKAWYLGSRNWKKLFGLNLIIALVILVGTVPIIAFVVLAMISLTAKIIAVILGIVWLVCYLIGLIAIGLTYPFMERIVVLDGAGALAGITHGINFFKKHWQEGLILYALNVGLTLLFFVLLLLAALALAIPIALIFFAIETIFKPVAILFLIIFGLIFFVAIFLASGFFGAFSSTIFTGAYVALKSHFISK